jgi:hypothetical protein
MPINNAGWHPDPHLPNQGMLQPTMQRGGYYASEFRSNIGVFGYAPKPNKDNSPPVCTPPGTMYNVNGIAADEKGNLIVPGSLRPSGRNTKYWVVSVYQGAPQNNICGPLLGSVPDRTGQPVDAVSFNAQKSVIAVSQIDFQTKLGEIVTCTLSSNSCSAPITSSYITGYSAGITMDQHGNCWLSTAKKISSGIPVGFRLIYFQGCTGNGEVATGTEGQSSYGGLFMDNAGRLGAFDAFNAKLHIYSGCNPTCTPVATYPLRGQSFYGGLNGAGHKLAVGDEQYGSVDVYNYSLPTFELRYSFDAGLRHARLVESGIFSPSNYRSQH